MKKLYLFAALATMLAACSENDLTAEKQVVQQNAEEGAVVFDAYQSRGTTRAGVTGTMTLDVLKQADAGFGVFSYYTNNEGYSELAKPDFMYNEKVTYQNSSWLYAPIKYWPNEFGTEAVSERIDYLSFFAYAPYVNADSKTGKVAKTSSETGIIALSRNTAIGDPLVKYVANFNPADAVDLCWGVVPTGGFAETVTSGEPHNSLEANKPYIDVLKPLTTSKIKFDFKHALSQLNVQIDADIDQQIHGDNVLNDQTRIYVRSVSFEGFTDRGTLNLNSTAPDPTWYDIAGSGNLSTSPITIYDGRYDGREGVTNVSAPAELPKGLNTKIIQSKPYLEPFASDANEPGVQTDAVNLFNSADKETPIMVIPNGQDLRVKVVYDVETCDPDLAQFLSDGKTHGSTIENAISKPITIASAPMKLAAGKKYIVKLHLGLTSVKFDAAVADWDPTVYTGDDAFLPDNNGNDAGNAIAAGTLAPTKTLEVNMSSAQGSVEFKFGPELADGAIGLGTETITPTVSIGSVTATGTASEGYADVELTVPANTSTFDVVRTVPVNDNGPTKTATVTINQAHSALGLSVETPATAGAKTFKIKSKATDVDFKTATINSFTRKRAGTTTAITPTVDDADGNITLAEDAQAGDVYTITVQSGQADAETVSFTVAPIPAEIVFTTPSPATPLAFTTFSGDILNNVAKLQLASDHSAISTGGGTITYSVNDDDYFDVSSNDGKLKFKGSWSVGDTRSVTVTATVTPGTNYSYETTSVSYTITVNAVAAP